MESEAQDKPRPMSCRAAKRRKFIQYSFKRGKVKSSSDETKRPSTVPQMTVSDPAACDMNEEFPAANKTEDTHDVLTPRGNTNTLTQASSASMDRASCRAAKRKNFIQYSFKRGKVKSSSDKKKRCTTVPPIIASETVACDIKEEFPAANIIEDTHDVSTQSVKAKTLAQTSFTSIITLPAPTAYFYNLRSQSKLVVNNWLITMADSHDDGSLKKSNNISVVKLSGECYCSCDGSYHIKSDHIMVFTSLRLLSATPNKKSCKHLDLLNQWCPHILHELCEWEEPSEQWEELSERRSDHSYSKLEESQVKHSSAKQDKLK